MHLTFMQTEFLHSMCCLLWASFHKLISLLISLLTLISNWVSVSYCPGGKGFPGRWECLWTSVHLESGTYSGNLGYRCGLLSSHLAQPCQASSMTSLPLCVLGDEGHWGWDVWAGRSGHAMGCSGWLVGDLEQPDICGWLGLLKWQEKKDSPSLLRV